MRLPSRRLAAAALALAALHAAPRAAAAQAGADSAAFVVTIGNDTLALERYTRTANRLTGELVTRTPRTIRRTYTAWLRPDGTVEHFETEARPLAGGPVTTARVEFRADSATWTVQRNDSTTTRTLATTGTAFPLVNLSHALYEQAILHARARGADSSAITLVAPGAGQTFAVTYRAAGPTGAVISNIAGRQRATLDERGRLVTWDGSESTAKFIARRVQTADLSGLASEFAARDAAGRGVGPLSPLDSTVVDVDGAHVAVVYSRPFARGRQLVGGVIPMDQVWRTGANAATILRTSRDLRIGNLAVPAGAYTLWTLPTQSGATLIINKQTGQWGTEYDAAQDLGRVELQIANGPHTEQFTIGLAPSGASAGTLSLAWGEFVASVPFTVQ